MKGLVAINAEAIVDIDRIMAIVKLPTMEETGPKGDIQGWITMQTNGIPGAEGVDQIGEIDQVVGGGGEHDHTA